MTNLPQLQEFIVYLKKLHYSEETVYNYERDLSSFSTFLEGKKIEFGTIDDRVINDFKVYLTSIERTTSNGVLAKKNLSDQSINRHLSSIKTFIKWIKQELPDLVIRDINISQLKNYKVQKEPVSVDSQIKLVEFPSKFEKNMIVAVRNRAILETLFSTGLRISELINLRKNQISEKGEILVESKNAKRSIGLSSRAILHIKKYLSLREEDDLPYLFVPLRGKNAGKINKKISPNYLQGRIKKYRELLGFDVLISAREMGHSFADYLAYSKMNPSPIKKILKHKLVNIETAYEHPL